MIKTRGFISIFISAALLLSCLCACGDKTGTVSETGESAPTESESEADTRIYADLPEATYDGYTYRILSWNGGWNTERDFAADEENGEPINDSVYSRNLAIEEKYKIIITSTFQDLNTVYTTIRKTISGGEDAYDLMYVRAIEFATQVTGNNFRDLLSLDYFEWDMPWWDSNVIDSLAVEGRAFGAVSDITTIDKDETCIVYYNKQIASDFNLPDFYDIVASGSWTIDKMVELSAGVSSDLNGNGENDGDDRFAIGSNMVAVTMLLHGGGGRYISRDEDGNPVVAIDDERTVTLCEKILTLMSNPSFFVNDHADAYVSGDLFRDDRVLFYLYALGAVNNMRNMETDFGIIPMVKYEESQEQYANTVSPHGASLMCVPLTASDTDRTAIIADALAAESYYTLRSAYYDIALKDKYLRDAKSTEMLDLIFASRVFDMGEFYRLGGLSDALMSLCISRKTEVASTLEKNKKAAEAAITRFMKSVEKCSG